MERSLLLPDERISLREYGAGETRSLMRLACDCGVFLWFLAASRLRRL
jgi:hypothetical protein